MGKYRMYRDNRSLTTKEELEIINSYHPTKKELEELNEWIKSGEIFDNNPYLIYEKNGFPSNFIEAYRFCQNMKEEFNNEQLQQIDE